MSPLGPEPGLTGRHLHDFVVGERIDHGGAAEVYSARQTSLDRDAVIKIMRAADDPATVARFQREARLASQLDHPYAAHVYAFGAEPDGVLWIALERVRGTTLADRLAARGPLPLPELVAVFEALCEVVATAHAAGLVHRDIKPANIMVIERAGRLLPKLLDFGIATLRGDDPGGGAAAPAAPGDVEATITAPGPAAGTPAYMAPEQWSGAAVDHRADIYALGIVAYRCLTGRLPHAATSIAELARAHAAAPVPPLGDGLPRGLDAVLARALAKAPSDRYDSALALARDLARAAGLASPRRRRVGWGAAAAALAGLVAAGLAWCALRPHEPWTPRLRLLPAYDENTDRPVYSPDGRQLAFASDRERGGWFRVHVVGVDGQGDRAITPPDRNFELLAWSAADRLLVLDTAEQATYEADLATGDLRRVAAGARAVPCGSGLLLRALTSPGCATCQRFVLRAADGTERDVLRLEPGVRVNAYRCDRVGARVTYAASALRGAGYQPSDVWIAELATGARRPLTSDAAFNDSPTFARDDRSVVFASSRGRRMNLWEVAVAGGRPLQLTTGEGNDFGADFAPDGAHLVYNVDSTALPLYARSARDQWRGERRVVSARARYQHLAMAVGSDEVIATDFALAPPQIVMIAPATGVARAIVAGKLAAPAPDGRELVYVTVDAPETIRRVPIAGGAATVVGAAPGRVEKLRVGADGWLHAMVDRDGSLEAWRIPLAGGTPVVDARAPWTFVVPGPGGHTAWLRYDPQTRGAIGVVAPTGRAPGPTDPTVRCGALGTGDFDARGAGFYHYDGAAVRRLDVATGRSEELFELGEIADTGLAVTADGATVYTAQTTGRIRRVVIENAAARPRP